MKLLFIALIIVLAGCTTVPTKSTEYVIKIESEIPVEVSVYKSCEGNWNFCKWQ